MVDGGEKLPLQAWMILSIAVVFVSSAGAVFQMMSDVPPLLRASWRLQVTALVLLPMFIFQLRLVQKQSKLKERLYSFRTLLILLGSGICLYIHFGAWVWSLDHTSLTHSLLFVTAHPLVIVIGSALLGHQISMRRWQGAILGFIGAAVVLFGGSNEGSVSFAGDLAAFIGAVAIVGYLVAGRTLRGWMPLFLYAFPVTLIAAVLLLITSMLVEQTSFSAVLSVNQALGWLNFAWLPMVLYLALGPGLVGHTGINHVLRWFTPLIISLSVLFEPIIGSLIGLALGTSEAPGFWTFFGGAMLIGGLALVISAETNEKSTPV
jgi:drug/metabolite transporter (DMT)-like permease